MDEITITIKTSGRVKIEREPVRTSEENGWATYDLGPKIVITIPAKDLEEMRMVQDFFGRIQQTSRRMCGSEVEE